MNLEIAKKNERKQKRIETAEAERSADLQIYKIFGNLSRRTFYALAGTVAAVTILAPSINLSVGLWQLRQASKDPDNTLFEEFGRRMDESLILDGR